VAGMEADDEDAQIHGWPDLSLGWRYQIPMLLDMGFRVVAPDMMGYGGTVSESHKLRHAS
jgi:pimeloyl-ACP methyl ester carboxylesterase